ncbi:MAG: ATP phosphoribosyltransferase [Planctomycetota bacterium]|jgi:ATP phosphoribosyltransferase
MSEKLKIAIPNKGRLFEKTIAILEEAGFTFDISARKLCTEVENFEMEILFTRTDDIPVYLEKNIVDLGITGIDIVTEHKSDLEPLLKLGFGKCRMIVAGPEGKYSDIKKLPSPCRVATSFPNIARSYFEDKGIDVEIADIHGAVEISHKLGLADAIVDITSSGTTLSMNELEIIDLIMNSEASLYANKKSMTTKADDINLVVESMKSVLAAHRKKYIMANVPKSESEKLSDIMPSITAPTVLNLAACPETVAVHSVISECEVNQTVQKLREIGAEGILVLNIERLFE